MLADLQKSVADGGRELVRLFLFLLKISERRSARMIDTLNAAAELWLLC